jgi:hypothetical protein
MIVGQPASVGRMPHSDARTTGTTFGHRHEISGTLAHLIGSMIFFDRLNQVVSASPDQDNISRTPEELLTLSIRLTVNYGIYPKTMNLIR